MSKYPGRIVTDLAPAGYSVAFDGTDDYLAVADNVNLRPGAGAFTLEAWIYRAAAGAAHTIYAKGGASTGIVFQVTATNVLRFTHTTTNIDSTGTIAATTWAHVAVVREGTGTNQTKLYINGVQDGQGTVSTDFTQTEEVRIGTNRGATEDFSGNISNLRFVKGSAVYTAVFTPPTQLFNITNTQLLTCNSPAIIDQSNNAFAITTNGDARVSTFTPFTAYVPYNPALGASTPGVWTIDEAMQARQTRQWNMYDPSFNSTTLLLHGNGTNGAQNNTFLDSSSNAFAITRNGNTTQGTFTPFSLQPGAWSNYFGGAGNYLTNTSAALITQNVSTFTVEGWVYLTATPLSTANVSGFIALDGVATTPTNYLSFGPDSNRVLQLRWFDTAGKTCTGSTTLALNTWYHIAAVVNANAISLYVNGVPEVVSGTTTLTNRGGTTSNFAVASNNNGSAAIIGYISNIRVTTTAVYSGRFNPSSVPFSAITGTVFLSCQSNRFVDNSASPLTLTIGGTPSVQAFSPFYSTAAYTPATVGGSGYFDGTGDFLSIAHNNVFNLNTGSWTIEFFVYVTDTTKGGLWGKRANTTQYDPLTIGCGSGALGIFGSTNNSTWNIVANGTQPVRTNSWNHLVVQYDGTNYTSYVNGVLDFTYAQSAPFTNTSAQLIGATDGAGTGVYAGYMGSVRLIKGQKLYSGATITVPNAPLTTTGYGSTSQSITGSVALLTNFTNAGIVDSTAKNALETVGNAQISTTQSKFGGSSMSFDGSGDYFVPRGLLDLGSGNFTVEFWLYPNSSVSGTYAGILDSRTSGSGAGLVYVGYTTTANQIGWYDNTSFVVTGTVTLSAWNHVAFVRSGSTLTMYVGGSSTATATYTQALSVPFRFIGTSWDNFALNGYIDDLRITRGIARYTGNFTPQTSQWQDE